MNIYDNRKASAEPGLLASSSAICQGREMAFRIASLRLPSPACWPSKRFHGMHVAGSRVPAGGEHEAIRRHETPSPPDSNTLCAPPRSACPRTMTRAARRRLRPATGFVKCGLEWKCFGCILDATRDQRHVTAVSFGRPPAIRLSGWLGINVRLCALHLRTRRTSTIEYQLCSIDQI